MRFLEFFAANIRNPHTRNPIASYVLSGCPVRLDRARLSDVREECGDHREAALSVEENSLYPHLCYSRQRREEVLIKGSNKKIKTDQSGTAKSYPKN